MRQTPGYRQKQPCNLPEETGVQLLYAASDDIWCRDSVAIHLHKEGGKSRIKTGLRQEDIVSPELFTATLESIRWLNW